MGVGDDVFFDREFRASGSILLDDSRIGGQLVCSGARLEAGSIFNRGYSLSAERIAVRGSVYFDRKFAAAGPVSLSCPKDLQ